VLLLAVFMQHAPAQSQMVQHVNHKFDAKC